MEASPSQRLGDSFSYGWLKCNKAAQPPSFGRLDAADTCGLGHSFNSSASFIDMDPGELFSMRWTAAGTTESDFDFSVSPCVPLSPQLVSADHLFCGGRLLPCENLHDDGALAHESSSSSPLFHSAQSTPASAASARAGRAVKSRPLLATRRLLLRYLRFLVPLCRKVRALRLLAQRPRELAASPARMSTSSFSSGVEWCHGNADTAVRDAILYCKRTIGQDM